MKIFRNKKGIDFAIALVVVVLVCLGFLFWQLNVKSKTIERDIGDAQIGLIIAQQDSDKTLFYLDQSAKYAAYDSVFQLGMNSGLANVSEGCGQIYGLYALWNQCDNPEDLTPCFPNFYENFKILLNEKLNDYLDDHPRYLDLRNNFKYSYVDGKLIGAGIKNIESTVYAYQPKTGADPNAGKYSFKPSFSIDFNYDFNKYFRLKELSDKIIVCARTSNTTAARSQCVAGLSDAHTTLLVPDGKYVLVNAEQPEFIYPFSPGSKTTIRFALCYPSGAEAPEVAIPETSSETQNGEAQV